ncbi:MAG: hypothetical protein PHR28_11085 [candidate division Zixibacteria bacterium]|nr:hypothetical protein [candidate division Zixibacteria bacterium]
MKCALCGFEFDESLKTTCAGCPVKSNCEFICCPRCGYKTVVSSPATKKIAGFFKTMFGGKNEKS